MVAHRSFSSLDSRASARRRACSAGVHRKLPPSDARRFRGDVPIATAGEATSFAGDLAGRSFAGDFVGRSFAGDLAGRSFAGDFVALAGDLPGDFGAGGMWIGELKLTRSLKEHELAWGDSIPTDCQLSQARSLKEGELARGNSVPTDSCHEIRDILSLRHGLHP